MKVKRTTLLMLACLVWTAAGFNIMRIGISEYSDYANLINVLLSLLVFAVFFKFIFWKMVKKHTMRIKGYGTQRKFILNFFDGKSFAIMAFMMSAGIILRSAKIVPTVFIAVFYTGLGAALLLAGLMFGKNFVMLFSEDSKVL